ncbi:hypothetical protein NW767_010415 [Fusarium falciforme]|nr:hypothetical protein NW767_010415 [Fusarium falciforme]
MQLEKGFGKVLIIRDINRLAKGGYSSEALGELTSFVQAYSGRMAIVLTRPSEPVDELLAERHELGTMCPDRITFQDLSPQDCLNLLNDDIFLASRRDPGGKHHWKLTEGMAMSCIKVLFHEFRDTGAAMRKIVSGETQETPEPQSGADVTQPTQATIEATSEPKRMVQATHQVENVAKAAISTSEASKLTEEQIKKRDSNQKDAEREKQAVQKAIKRMSKCEQRFDWDRVARGYRCQGGTHFVSDAEVADAMR